MTLLYKVTDPDSSFYQFQRTQRVADQRKVSILNWTLVEISMSNGTHLKMYHNRINKVPKCHEAVVVKVECAYRAKYPQTLYSKSFKNLSIAHTEQTVVGLGRFPMYPV